MQKKEEIETKLRRRTQLGFETVRQLNCTQIRFLLAHKFPQNMKQKYGDLKVEPDMKNSIITFTGVSDDIINAKVSECFLQLAPSKCIIYSFIYPFIHIPNLTFT